MYLNYLKDIILINQKLKNTILKRNLINLMPILLKKFMNLIRFKPINKIFFSA